MEHTEILLRKTVHTVRYTAVPYLRYKIIIFQNTISSWNLPILISSHFPQMYVII